MISQNTQAALDRYVNHRIAPGSFLTAVLAGDLFDAVSRADSESLVALPDIVKFIYNKLPGHAWGSREQVAEWLNAE